MINETIRFKYCYVSFCYHINNFGGVKMNISVQKIIKVVYGTVYLDSYLKFKEGYKKCEVIEMYDLKSRARLDYIIKVVSELESNLNSILKIK